MTDAEKKFKDHRDLKLRNEKLRLEGEITKRIVHFNDALK